MAGEPQSSEETRLLREEVAQQKAEQQERDRREARAEELKYRVSVAAIILTTAPLAGAGPRPRPPRSGPPRPLARKP